MKNLFYKFALLLLIVFTSSSCKEMLSDTLNENNGNILFLADGKLFYSPVITVIHNIESINEYNLCGFDIDNFRDRVYKENIKFIRFLPTERSVTYEPIRVEFLPYVEDGYFVMEMLIYYSYKDGGYLKYANSHPIKIATPLSEMNCDASMVIL